MATKLATTRLLLTAYTSLRLPAGWLLRLHFRPRQKLKPKWHVINFGHKMYLSMRGTVLQSARYTAEGIRYTICKWNYRAHPRGKSNALGAQKPRASIGRNRVHIVARASDQKLWTSTWPTPHAYWSKWQREREAGFRGWIRNWDVGRDKWQWLMLRKSLSEAKSDPNLQTMLITWW